MKTFYKRMRDISEKIKTVDKGAVKVSVIVSVLFISVWLIYGIHLNDFSRLYRNIMTDLIMAQTENESEGISREIGLRCNIVGYVSKSVSRVKTDEFSVALPSILTTALTSARFEEIVYIDDDGTVYFPDGTKSQDHDAKKIMEKCDLTTSHTVFNNKDYFITDKDGFCIVAPVHDGLTVKGYVCGAVAYDTIVKDSNIRREVVHDEVILDSEGKVLAQIYDSIYVVVPEKEHSFFDYAQAGMTEEDFSVLTAEYTECIDSKVSGKSYADIYDDNQLLIYYPIEGTDGWSVMNCYPRAVIKSRMRRIQVTAIIMFTIIVCIMICAAVILLRFLNEEKKRVTALEFLDGLTGAYNRSAFIARCEEILKENKNLPYYMICFDVVNFRIINETYGHERSDNIIIEMANGCKEAFGHSEVYGRLTADVFVALTLDDGEEDERIKFIESRVAEEAKRYYINHPIKVKRGRYEVTDITESINRMIDKANIARKYVNLNANDLSCRYTDDLMNDARKAEEIESKMHLALQNGEFKPFLQPKFNMVENKISGAEALVRWIQDDGTIVPPGDFIPLFERNGFVEKVDFYMLEEICKYIRKMIDENREVYKVSVNQSRYLMNDPEYVAKVKAILLKYQIPVGLIELELTETVFFHEKERMIKMMNDLKLMNVDLSIDDFGSGYSSFNILKDVPFDVLKIDREFLSDTDHTEKGKWILKEIVEMAHGLGMSVICEGVETKEQIDLLVSIHCHYAQGFYFSRPIPLQEFIDKYNTVKE